MGFENKVVEFEKKLDKYAFNVNILNKVIAILTALFVVFSFVFYIKRSNQIERENAIYDKMLADLEAHQLAVIYSNVTPNSGQVDMTKVPEKPMYTNAKDAVIDAHNKLYSYSAYEIWGYGTTRAEAVGQQVEVGIGYKNYKFLTGTQLDENVRKEINSNFGQTDSIQILYKNGNRYERHGTNIRKEGNYWTADFTDNFVLKNLTTRKHNFYIVNEQTVQFSKSFSFARDEKGMIAYYKATVILDPKESVKEYAIDIMEQGETSFPEFSFVELACIIDRDGHLMSYTTTEKMTLSKHIVVDITTTTTSEFTSIIMSHDVAPRIAEPNI